jgi:hypothetical protein
MWTEPIAIQVAIAILATLSGSLYFVYKQRKGSTEEQSKDAVDKGTNGERSVAPSVVTPKTKTSKSSTDPSDAWEERRRRGIPAASLHLKKDADSKKPFGSSYYYAHNSSKTTGGYKDGLRMEDFTMNGPRLLSRNGAAVDDGDDKGDGDEDVTNASVCDVSTAEDEDDIPGSTIVVDQSRRTVLVTRFLWDDPGDTTKGSGTIRIDELPSCSASSEFVPWKEAADSIANIVAVLINNNEGLQVKIETIDGVDYLLRIPKLYGEVTGVEATSKTKRLLVKLTKKRGLLDKSNLKAWPHPHKQAR